MKLSLSRLLMLLTVPSFLAASCGVGTLACSKASGQPKPVVCDFFNSFVLDAESSACKKTTLANCLVPRLPNSQDACYLCRDGHVLDDQTGQCVPVQAQSIKKHCEQYSKPSFSCLKCASGFFVSAGTCAALGEAKIEYCEIYRSALECQVCEPGTFLDDKICHVFPVIQNCLFHRNVHCDRCLDEHFLDVSANPAYNQSSFLFSGFSFAEFVHSDPRFEFFTTSFGAEVCRKGGIRNCKVYESFSTCKECFEGYYINSAKQCDRLQEPPLEGCKVYASATQCAKCQFKFVLTRATGTCYQADEVESCVKYHASDNKCARCEKKLYLSPAGTCTGERVDSLSIANCEETAANKDECATCKEGHSLSVRNKLCFKDISHCEDQAKSNEVDAFHTCNRCAQGFHQNEDRSQCLETKILRCMELVLQKNECQKCEPGYYFDAEKTQCVNQFVENCAEYREMTNDCTKCANLFYLQGQFCQLVTASELCHESDGLLNKCLKCKPQYLKSGNTCSPVNMRSNDVIDSMCVSNVQETPSSVCTECAPNHFILPGTMAAILPEDLLAMHCAKVNPENGACLQCLENSSGDGTKCLAPDPNLTTECLQLKEGYFGLLGNGNCAKCRDSAKKYLDPTNGYCSSRLNPTINDYCEEFPVDDGDCVSCKEEHFPHVESELRDQCYAISDLPNYSAIQNCKIYNATEQKCFLCSRGYRPNSGTGCELYAYSVLLNFDNNLNIVSQSNFDLILHCKTYRQIDLGTVRCSECNTNYVNIVKLEYAEGEEVLYDYNSLGINVGLGGFSLPVEKCIQFEQSYQRASGGNSITTDSCDVGFQHEEKPGYACIRCKINKNGIVVELDKDKDGNPLGKTLKGIDKCFQSTSDFTNTFEGIGYHLRYQKNYIPYVIFMRYSDCQNSSNSLIFNSIVNRDGSIQLEKIIVGTGIVKPIMECTNISTNNPFYNSNPNCQIFGYSSIPAPSHNSNNPPVDLCLACKPGFKAVLVPDSGHIQTCVSIAQCNNPRQGKYLNGCSDPTVGYKLDTPENNQLILFDELVQSTNPIAFCLVYSYNMTKCVVCKKGYSLIRGSCTEVVTPPEYKCRTAGYGLNDLNLHYSLNTNQRLMNYSYFLVNKFNIENLRKTLCSVCDSNHIVAIRPEKNKMRCYPSAGANESMKIPNCLRYSASSPVTCAVCTNGYIPNIFKGECVGASNYPNCLTLTDLDPAKCSTCDPDYVVDELGKCVLSNCKRTLQNKCVLCNDGFKPKEGSDTQCERNLDSSDDCLAYSPKMKTCGKCRNGGVLYLFYEKESSENVYKGFACEPGLLIPGNLPGWRHYHLDEVYIEVFFNPDSQTVITGLGSIEHNELKDRLFLNLQVDKNPAKTHCFASRVVENCLPESLLGGVFCAQCGNGTLLDRATNRCKTASTVPSCGVYISDTECQECLPTHYLASSKSCLLYSPNMNCKTAIKDKNQCLDCEDGFFLNLTKFCEQRRSDLNCKDFAQSENKCASCLEGFLFQPSSRACIRRTARNCEEVHTSQDKCSKCKQGYWMDRANGDLCRASTKISNCQEYLPSADGCQTCSEAYYATDEGKLCKERPDGIRGCETYSDFGVCSRCHAEHFLTNNQCQKATTLVDNCLYYRAEGMCLQCKADYFLDLARNSCEPTSISNCLEFSSATTCKKCEPNYVLKWNDQELGCESSNISGCLVSVGGSTNTCSKCEEGKVLSVDKTKCESTTPAIPNCEEFYTNTQCSGCKVGYVLSRDRKTCQAKPLSTSTTVTNCASEVSSRKFACDTCKPGFKKNSSGLCEACGGDGCLICGSGTASCNVCKGSYHMNSELKCVPNARSTPSDFTA